MPGAQGLGQQRRDQAEHVAVTRGQRQVTGPQPHRELPLPVRAQGERERPGVGDLCPGLGCGCFAGRGALRGAWGFPAQRCVDQHSGCMSRLSGSHGGAGDGGRRLRALCKD